MFLFLNLFVGFSEASSVKPSVTKQEMLRCLLPSLPTSCKERGVGFAPVNIALCKYWGKRDKELNLPRVSSLSIALPYGTKTVISFLKKGTQDEIILNNRIVPPHRDFAKRTREFLDLFRPTPETYFRVETWNQLSTGAGLASSASGFAAFVLALNDLMGWELKPQDLSVMARLGSGSAARSLYSGVVLWNKGEKWDGTDSKAEPFIMSDWKALRLGLLEVSDEDKEVSSRDGMNLATRTSPYYEAWVKKNNEDLEILKTALRNHDLKTVGQIAESNAMAMHATALTSWPPLMYWSPQTVAIMHKVWALRHKENCDVYFTIDAGPNVILIFTVDKEEKIKSVFPRVIIMKPLMQPLANVWKDK